MILCATSLVLISSTCPDPPLCAPPPPCRSLSASMDPFACECRWLCGCMPLRLEIMPCPWPPKLRARCSSLRESIACVGLKAAWREHLVVGEVRTWPVGRQRLLGVVERNRGRWRAGITTGPCLTSLWDSGCISCPWTPGRGRRA